MLVSARLALELQRVAVENHVPLNERLTVRQSLGISEKGVYVLLVDAVLALALNRNETAVVTPGNDIDADIGTVSLKPLVPAVNFRKPLPIHWGG